MGNLKSSILFMKQNNSEGRYDSALEKQKNLFKYFLTEVPERVETAALAA